jgi:hypothetical protein
MKRSYVITNIVRPSALNIFALETMFSMIDHIPLATALGDLNTQLAISLTLAEQTYNKQLANILVS